MQKTPRNSFLILIGFILLAPCAFAGGRKTPANDEIIAVNKEAKSITIQGQNHATFTADADTRIIVNGKPGTFANLKKGMRVFIGHKTGSTTARLIDADAAVKKGSK